jgi:tetraprenyl-beta-curcumene synthase
LSARSDASLWRDLNRTLITLIRTPTRLRRLFAFGWLGLIRMIRYLTRITPYASKLLAEIRAQAVAIPDPALREQALASIDRKAFHVQGGSILATFLPPRAARRYVDIVAPLETIYDYLDNVCDRLDGVPERAYATLHEALLDAVDPRRPLGDYYRDGPHGDDGGYLLSLVGQSRAALAALPSLDTVQERIVEVTRFYAELQTFKHSQQREEACRRWHERSGAAFATLAWWEFAAACGSSLPVFAMLYMASRRTPRAADIGAVYHAYFPHVSAVHIMLDYFIDQAEDREHHELNFVACYASSDEALERIGTLIARAAERLGAVAGAEYHLFLLNAMCLFYLTHEKVFEQDLDRQAVRLLSALDGAPT